MNFSPHCTIKSISLYIFYIPYIPLCYALYVNLVILSTTVPASSGFDHPHLAGLSGCGLGGRVIPSPSSPHVEVSLGKILNPKLPLMCMSSARECVGVKLRINVSKKCGV